MIIADSAAQLPLAITERLTIRKFTTSDAPFILELLNTSGWLSYINDRNVRSLADAEEYLLNGPIRNYEEYGFGHYLVLHTATSRPAGMCGIIKRKTLDHPDIGFAFLPGFCGQGYAFEAASAILEYCNTSLKFTKLVAVTSRQNDLSIKLLDKLGLQFEKPVIIKDDGSESLLYSINLNGR